MTTEHPPFSELIEQRLVTTEPLSPEQAKMVDRHMAIREKVAKEMEEEKAAVISLAERARILGCTEREIAQNGGNIAPLTALVDGKEKQGAAGEVAPLALTDRNIAALSRAIEAEGYRIMVDPETGDVKLEKDPS